MSDRQRSQTEALLIDYWYILKKRKLVVLAFTGFLTITVAIATMLATPYYAATALMEISPKAPQVYDVDEVSDFVSARSAQELRNYYATQYKIIQSRSVMMKTVSRLQEKYKVTDFDDMEKPYGFLRKHLVMEPVIETHLVRVTFEYPDADKAALFANALVETYIEFNLERALGASQQALTWLQDQHDQYRNRKYESDAAVHEYKYENELAGVDERYNTTIDTMSKLQAAWSDAHSQRIQVQAIYSQLDSLAQEEDWAPLANHLSSESVVIRDMLTRFDLLKQEQASLASRYKERHPEMIRVNTEKAGLEKQVRGQINDIVAGRKTELVVLQNRERALDRELTQIKVEVEELDKKLIELKFLEAEAERNETFYKSLDNRMSEVDLSQVLRANNVRVIDAAVSGGAPVRPKLPVNLAMGLVLGIFGGCALAFFMEYLDVTVKTREDIEQVIGIPMLGVVPALDPEDLRTLKSDVERAVFVHARPRSTVAECLRSIRTNVMFRTPQRGVRTLLVTSAAPREGKSFTSINLSTIIAMTGSRVLLIDADLRRPAMHKRFGMTNEEGLCALFSGEMSFEQVVQHSHVPGLDVLVAGPPPPNPGELLGGGHMAKLLESLTDYDVIVIDTPPVNVVADPLVLSELADGVVLVVEANRTSRNVVLQAHTRLKEMNAQILGAIVNKLNIRTAGYGYYYYDTYGYYYTEAEQTKNQKTG